MNCHENLSDLLFDGIALTVSPTSVMFCNTH
jgi:hypothetical protein